MFNGGEFSKILDEIFEKDDKEKEKAIKIYCKIWKYLENITLQNLKYKRAFEILKDYNSLPPLEEFRYSEYQNCYFAEVEEDYYNCGELETQIIHYVLEKEQYELLEELMSDE